MIDPNSTLRNGARAISVAAAAACFCAFMCPAQAQNRQLVQENDTISAMTAEELAAVFTSIGFEANASVDDNGAPVIEVAAPEAGVFYVVMRDCIDGACEFIQPYGVFSGDGVTLGQLNEINLTMLQTGSAMLLPDGDGLIGSRIFLHGGISNENFGFQLGAFIEDIDRLVSAIRPGSIATVSFSKTDNVGAQSDPVLKPRKGDVVNPVGANAPRFMTDAARALLND